MSVTVRFAPSPTGFLHIGGARTALFNWLFARHHGGAFRLRIEDTDRERSTPEATKAIVEGLKWLGLEWDGVVVYQFSRAQHHAEIARRLLAEGNAYYCYCTPEELEAMRERARAEGRSIGYDGTWRDRDPSEAPPGIDPVIRLRAPREGATTIRDHVLGEVTVENQELDDLIILRSDGTPTYNFSVVVDDHDMGITHVIRGNEHFRNAFRQVQIYRALGWPIPEFAHLPLIHGSDGTKLSKRHGALGVEAYRDMGYLPEALRNYLLRLGWSHGDDEIISTEQAIAWFDLDGIGRAPAQFDFAKLDSINAHYIREANDARLLGLVAERLENEFGRTLSEIECARLVRAMPALKPRAKTIVELAEKARFYVSRVQPDERAKALLAKDRGGLPSITVLPSSEVQRAPGNMTGLLPQIQAVLADTEWNSTQLSEVLRGFAKERGLNFGEIAQLLRAALTGSLASPSIFEVIEVLGRDETLARIQEAAWTSR